MKLRSIAAACLASLIAVATPAAAVTIDFGDVSVGTAFPSPYERDGVTFLSPDSLLVTDIGTGNAICGAVGGVCGGGIAMEFAEGARFLRLTLSGDTNPTTQFIFEAFGLIDFGGELLPLQLLGIIFADGNPLNEQVQEFTSPFLTLTGFGISSLDGTPFVIDNISFEPGALVAVPEPATWAMMIGGIGAAGGLMRRRRATPALRTA